jgi:3-oxoacyl-[acyl-carrier protein] reductase
MACDINARGLSESFPDKGDFGSKLSLQVLDVCSSAQWKGVIEQMHSNWGGIDVCLNVAGVLAPAKIQDATERDINLQLDVNVKGACSTKYRRYLFSAEINLYLFVYTGVVFGTKFAAEAMAKQATGGHIVNVSSMAAVAPVTGVTIYATSK